VLKCSTVIRASSGRTRRAGRRIPRRARRPSRRLGG
jgi:hypothetical protein